MPNPLKSQKLQGSPMPNRQKSQNCEEALCQIHRNQKLVRKPYAKSSEIPNFGGSPMQNRRFREKPAHFAKFSPIFKEKLNF